MFRSGCCIWRDEPIAIEDQELSLDGGPEQNRKSLAAAAGEGARAGASRTQPRSDRGSGSDDGSGLLCLADARLCGELARTAAPGTRNGGDSSRSIRSRVAEQPGGLPRSRTGGGDELAGGYRGRPGAGWSRVRSLGPCPELEASRSSQPRGTAVFTRRLEPPAEVAAADGGGGL